MTVPVSLHGKMQEKPIKGEGFQKGGLHKKGRVIFKKKQKKNPKSIRYCYTELIY